MDPLTSLKQFMTRGGNLQQLLRQTPIANPLINNLISLAQKGNAEGIETFARNLFKEQGRDFDKEFNDFKNSMK